MKRTLAGLVTALAALLAMSAVIASAAQAEIGTFTTFNTTKAQHESGTVSGNQLTTHEYTSGPVGTLKCEEASFSGTAATGTETSLSIAPKYNKCRTTIGGSSFKTEIHVNNCYYTFKVVGKEVSVDTWNGSIDLICPKEPGGKPESVTITIYNAAETAVKCTLHLEPKNNIGGITYHNETKAVPTDVVLTTDMKEIPYLATGGLLNCGVGEATQNNGTYKGNSTFTAKNTAGEPIDLTVMTGP